MSFCGFSLNFMDFMDYDVWLENGKMEFTVGRRDGKIFGLKEIGGFLLGKMV